MREQGSGADERVQDEPLVCLGRILGERVSVGEVHGHVTHLHGCAGHLRAELEGQALVRLDADDERVLAGFTQFGVAERDVGRTLEDDGDLGDALAETLASAQVEGNARPAACVHKEFDRSEGFGGRVGRDAVLLEVAAHMVAALPAAGVLSASRIDGQVLGQAHC